MTIYIFCVIENMTSMNQLLLYLKFNLETSKTCKINNYICVIRNMNLYSCDKHFISLTLQRKILSMPNI